MTGWLLRRVRSMLCFYVAGSTWLDTSSAAPRWWHYGGLHCDFFDSHCRCDDSMRPRFCDIFPQTVWNFTHLLFVSMYADCKFLSNYLQFLRSYAILSVTTQFTPYVQNVHHRPKRTLVFSDIFPKHLGIFGPNFSHLLFFHIFAGLQIFLSNYLQL